MKKAKPVGHVFRIKVVQGDGEVSIYKARTKVYDAKRKVVLTLTAADVQRSIDAETREKGGGVGNSYACSMALCAKRQAAQFPHPVEGAIDWSYRRAWVVSKVSAQTGMPATSVVYGHNDEIAQLNDSRGGQLKLLAQLLRHGPRQVTLYPVVDPGAHRYRSKTPSAEDGSRTKRKNVRGANLRYITARAGGVVLT